MPTDVSILSGTGASVTPERRIPRKTNTKSPAMLPPRNDPIINQYSTRNINRQDSILPPLLAKYTTVYKPLFNDAYYPNKTEDDLNDYTDNSHTDINDYLNKLSIKKDEDKDD